MVIFAGVSGRVKTRLQGIIPALFLDEVIYKGKAAETKWIVFCYEVLKTMFVY